jgi:hypothetical protein
MKRLIFSMVIMGSLCHFLGAQQLYRVNNTPGINADYTTLQAAVDAATGGDTIYMEGSTTEYAGATVDKALTIVGPGYFLNENPKTQANMLEAQFNSAITFDAGSEGSSIMGCNVIYYNLTINADDIRVIRNYLEFVVCNATCNNILVTQNYVRSNIQAIGGGALTNSVISNNIIGGQIWTQGTSGPLVVSNNIFTTTSYAFATDCYNANIQNNIVSDAIATIRLNTGNSINNNILATDGTDANGNQYNIDMTTVFADFDGQLGMSTDGKWALKAGSPALGAGVSGVDCGIFGGLAPYILSGIPNLPHIYEASVQAAATSESGLQVTIKVKSGDN